MEDIGEEETKTGRKFILTQVVLVLKDTFIPGMAKYCQMTLLSPSPMTPNPVFPFLLLHSPWSLSGKTNGGIKDLWRVMEARWKSVTVGVSHRISVGGGEQTSVPHTPSLRRLM